MKKIAIVSVFFVFLFGTNFMTYSAYADRGSRGGAVGAGASHGVLRSGSSYRGSSGSHGTSGGSYRHAGPSYGKGGYYRGNPYYRRGGHYHGSYYHGGYWRGGVWISPGYGWYPWPWWGYPYPYYPYYAYPPAVVEKQPPIYVDPAPDQQEPGYWYFCKDPEGYYPYVQQCPGGWTKVTPSPTPPDVRE